MGVVDIRGKGGKLPEPEGGIKVIPSGEGEDPLKQTEQDMARAVRLRTYQMILEGRPPPAPVPAVKETYGLNIGDVIKAQGEQIVGLIGQITTLVTKNPESQQAPLLQHLMDELKETRTRLETAPDPLDYLVTSQERLDQIAQRFKASLGLPAGMTVAGQNLPQLIQLEDMKMEREERERQWKMEMEERRHQWAREDQRWQEEFRLKKMQFFDDQDRREKSGSLLSRLAGGLLENVETEGGEGVAQQPLPQSFPCEVCRTAVPIPPGTTSGTKVSCPRCQEVYALEAKA